MLKNKDDHYIAHEDHHCVTLVPLFGSLAPEEIAQVEQVVHQREYQKDEEVINPYSEPQLTIVAHGALKIYQLSGDGKEQLLRVVEPGGYEGENALFGAVNENLYGETLQNTTICFLRQNDFRQLLLKYPKLSLRLLEINAQKSEEMQHQAQFLMMEDIESRLANYLLQLSQAADSTAVVLPMKMKELATYLGTTPETLSRKLKLLEEGNYIIRKGKKITIRSIDDLEDDYA